MEPVILIAEDDADIRRLLRLYLEGEGFRVLEADNGASALALARERTPDMAILDVMMPEMNGFELTRALRRYSNVPILILSARSQDNDKILGLNLGADDYVTKPFNPVEVLARVKSQLRRYLQLGGGVVQPTTLQAGGIVLDDRAKSVTLDGEPVALTPREYDILRLLLQHPGTVFSPKQIYRTVWGEEPYGVENAVAVHIRHLREKLEITPSDPRYIKVVWGQGYKLEGGKP